MTLSISMEVRYVPLTEFVYLVMNDDTSPQTTPIRKPNTTTMKNFAMPSRIWKKKKIKVCMYYDCTNALN